jgi:hypothetical protein
MQRYPIFLTEVTVYMHRILSKTEIQFLTAYMLGSKYFRLLRDTGTVVTECDSALISGANVEYLKAHTALRPSIVRL